jgi:hypothetical protein
MLQEVAALNLFVAWHQTAAVDVKS